MKIGEAMNPLVGMNQLQPALKEAEAAAEEIATGTKINEATDDPSSLVVSESMKAQINELLQKAENVSMEIQQAQTAEGAYAAINESLQRIEELIVQSENGTLTGEDQAIIQQEIDQLVEGIGDVAANTQFNGQNVISGDLVSQLGLDTVSVNNPDSGEAVAAAIEEVNSARAEFGSVIEAKTAQIEVLEQTADNLIEAQSTLADADVAESTGHLAIATLKAETTTYSIGQKNDTTATTLRGVLGIDEYA